METEGPNTQPPPPPGFETRPVQEAAPSAPGARLRIAISGWGRTVALTKAFFAAVFALAFLVQGINAHDVAGVTDEEATVRLVTGIVLALGAGWAAWVFAIPGFARKAYLELGPDNLVVRHPGLFKYPLIVPRDAIKAAGIDPRPWRWRWVGNKGRFHLAGNAALAAAPTDSPAPPAGLPPPPPEPTPLRSPRELPEWLFSVVGGSPFPLLSNVDDVPNVAFVFTEPIRLRAVRRGLRPFATKNPVHVPLQARQVRGVLVKLKDIDHAGNALSAWTTVRPLTADDVVEVEPDEAYRKRAKKRHRVANVWLGILLFVQFGIPGIAHVIDRADDDGPTHETTLL
jgi:hypothetical protein